MEINKVLEYWKSILTFTVFIVASTIGVLSWAGDQKAQMEARQSLIHDEMYQENRIDKKRQLIKENRREIDLIKRFSNGQLSAEDSRRIAFLEADIIRLEADIEEIRANLATKHE